VTVPPGATAGSSVPHVLPDGRELDITVPEGVPPGSLLVMTQDPCTKAWSCACERLGPAETAAGPARATVVVPPGTLPGTTLAARTPDGRELDVTLPEGVPAGSTLVLTEDPSTKRWSCSVEPPSAAVAAPAAATPAPAAAGPQKFTITVPESAKPGTPLYHTTPDGKELEFAVPAGVPPGYLLNFTQDPHTGKWGCTAEPPPTEAPPVEKAEPLKASCVVPPGALPGTTLPCYTPDGRELEITVPEGVPAGSTLALMQDPITLGWKAVVEHLGPTSPVNQGFVPPTFGGRDMAGASPAKPAAAASPASSPSQPEASPEPLLQAVSEDLPTTMTITVPAGAYTGMLLERTAPDGQALSVNVPEGVVAGMVLKFVQDPLSRTWSCTAGEAEADAMHLPMPSTTDVLKATTASMPTMDCGAFEAQHQHQPDGGLSLQGGWASTYGPGSLPVPSAPAAAYSPLGISPSPLGLLNAGAPSLGTTDATPATPVAPAQPPEQEVQAPSGVAEEYAAGCGGLSFGERPGLAGAPATGWQDGLARAPARGWQDVGQCAPGQIHRSSSGGDQGYARPAECGGLEGAGLWAPPEQKPTSSSPSQVETGELAPPFCLPGGPQVPQGDDRVAPPNADREAAAPVPWRGSGEEQTASTPGMSQVTVWYCQQHNSSDKRPKSDTGKVWHCRGCHVEVNTNYKEFAFCQPCSHREKRCMVCGEDARTFSSQMTVRPREPEPPLQASSVPPRYCAQHGSSERRHKVNTPKFWDCLSCGRKVSTNYSTFTFCPPCSERDMQCMICGAAALEAGNYVPPATLGGGSQRCDAHRLGGDEKPPLPAHDELEAAAPQVEAAPFVNPPALQPEAEQPRVAQQVLSYIPPPQNGTGAVEKSPSYVPMPLPAVEAGSNFTPLPVPNLEADASPRAQPPMILPGACQQQLPTQDVTGLSPSKSSPANLLGTDPTRMLSQGPGGPGMQQQQQQAQTQLLQQQTQLLQQAQGTQLQMPPQQQQQQPQMGYIPPAFGSGDQNQRFYQPPAQLPPPHAMRPPGMMDAQGCNINTRPPPNQPGMNPFLMGVQDPIRPGGPPGPVLMGGHMPFGGMGPGPFQQGYPQVQPGQLQPGFPPKLGQPPGQSQQVPPFGVPPQVGLHMPQGGFFGSQL